MSLQLANEFNSVVVDLILSYAILQADPPSDAFQSLAAGQTLPNRCANVIRSEDNAAASVKKYRAVLT
jgi:hypothetical protein